jgi:hypothetical protein
MKPPLRSGFKAPRRVASTGLARLLLATSLIVGSAVMAAEAGDQATPPASSTPAKWTPRKLHFIFQGFTTHYSCDGLQDQMKSILQKLGAGKDLVVKPSGCTRLEGPEPFPGVTATFSVLEPAGGGAQGATDSHDVAAQWDTVTLNSATAQDHTGSSDCELIEQVKRHVLPLFTTRNLNFSDDCFPHTATIAGARLSVEVLRPVKSPPTQPTPP